MPANNDFPELDGIAPSWADIIVTASPSGAPLIDMKDIAAINTSGAVEVGMQKAGGRLMKRTAGDESNEASMTLYRDGYNKLLRGLVDLAPKRGNEYMLRYVHFGVNIQHTPYGSTEIYEIRIKGCCILGWSGAFAEGTDADKIEVTLNPAKISVVIDGKEVVLL